MFSDSVLRVGNDNARENEVDTHDIPSRPVQYHWRAFSGHSDSNQQRNSDILENHNLGQEKYGIDRVRTHQTKHGITCAGK